MYHCGTPPWTYSGFLGNLFFFWKLLLQVILYILYIWTTHIILTYSHMQFKILINSINNNRRSQVGLLGFLLGLYYGYTMFHHYVYHTKQWWWGKKLFSKKTRIFWFILVLTQHSIRSLVLLRSFVCNLILDAVMPYAHSVLVRLNYIMCCTCYICCVLRSP